MARYFNIQITEVYGDGPFTVYYNSVDAGNIATLTSNDSPAENITRTDLTSAEGVGVYIPDDSLSIILYNADANVIAGCGINTVIKTFSVTPTPTPTVTVTPTPTITPTPTPSTPEVNIGIAGQVTEIDVFGTSKVSIGLFGTKLNESTRNGFVEANANGNEDTDFWNEISPGFLRDSWVKTVAIDQSTGTKFIGGRFSQFKNVVVNPTNLGKKGIVKLDSNGVIDESFNT